MCPSVGKCIQQFFCFCVSVCNCMSVLVFQCSFQRVYFVTVFLCFVSIYACTSIDECSVFLSMLIAFVHVCFFMGLQVYEF